MDADARAQLWRLKREGKTIIMYPKDIVAIEIRNYTLLRKWKFDAYGERNQNRIIGLLGETGASKSIGAATIAFVDYMLMNQPCFSNLEIDYYLELPDKLLDEYEYFCDLPISREPIHYHSIPIDFKELLSFNPKYRDGVVLIDEINVALADAWRSMTNQSLAASDWVQQLRKMRCAMIHTALSEMFVPNRIRDATDLYIGCRDLAYYNKYQHQNPGVTFEWKKYHMTGKVAGYENVYREDAANYELWYFHGRKSWTLIDTDERQHRKRLGITPYENEVVAERKYGIVPEVKESQELEDAKARWSWLFETPTYNTLVNGGFQEIEKWELVDAIKHDATQEITIDDDEIASFLEGEFNPRVRWTNGRKIYSHFKLKGKEREATLITSI